MRHFATTCAGLSWFFFDDILVYSPDWESHLLHLRLTLEVLHKHQLFAKDSKCDFGVRRVDYLGHIISQEGVAVDPSKINAILEWPVPTTITALHGFLGLTGYYRKFVRHYATLAAPLTDLLKHNCFTWNDFAYTAFTALKEAMVTLPVLALPDFNALFDVTTDASGVAIGAVLSQHNHPLAFYSRKMSPRMQAASAYDREMFAITEAARKWRQYLLGRRFRFYTDQKSLKGLLNQVIQTPSQQRWLTKLLGYDYEILYMLGKQNRVADALSRIPETESVYLALSTCQPLLVDQLQKFYQDHPAGQALLSKLHENSTHFSIAQGILYFKGHIFIPLETNLRPVLLQEFHNSTIGGHSGIKGTMACLTAAFSWPNMTKDVKLHIKECSTCQSNKYMTQKPSGLLQPLPIPTQVWQDITMDFITHLPPSHGKTVIWVIIDRLTKFAHFLALPIGFSATSIAPIFLTEVY